MYSPKVKEAAAARIAELDKNLSATSNYVQDLGFLMLHGFIGEFEPFVDGIAEKPGGNINHGLVMAYLISGMEGYRSNIEIIRRRYNIPE